MPYICQCGCGQEIPPSWTHQRKAPRFIRGHFARSPEAAASRHDISREGGRKRRPVPTLVCQCGCGQTIPPKPSHRYRPSRFIQSHYLAMPDTERVRRRDEEQAKRRTPPPADWTAPPGVCGCGCGAPTRIAKLSRPERGQYAGYPLRFVNGHNATAMMSAGGNGQWKGGRQTTSSGYVLIQAPDEPGAQHNGYILEHRLVYQRSRGVILHPRIEVHHENGVRDDNRPENLIASAKGAHKRAHVLAGAIVSLFTDARLYEAAKAHVLATGALPDLAALTQELYADHATAR